MWKRQSTFTLEKFISQHRCAFINMPQCATHIDYQLPNERTRVTHLLNNIDCDYSPLQASIALVKSDVGTNGKMNNFEATSSFLLPNDPVLKNKTSNDCYFIAEVDGGIDDDKNQEDGTIRVV